MNVQFAERCKQMIIVNAVQFQFGEHSQQMFSLVNTLREYSVCWQLLKKNSDF